MQKSKTKLLAVKKKAEKNPDAIPYHRKPTGLLFDDLLKPKAKLIAKKKTAEKNPDTVPYHRKPTDLSLEGWQIALRRQFVTGKDFAIKKLDGHQVFSDYSVYNPETRNTYKVAIRNNEQVMNFCTCLDFKTNHLGTCKHIEAVLIKIRSVPRLASLLKKGYTPPYSSVYLQYGKERKVKLRIGTDSAVKFKKTAREYFDKEMTLTSFGFVNFEQFRNRAIAIDPDFRCYDDALGFILETREKQRRMKWIDERYPEGQELEGILTTKLVSSLVDKDPASGKTYLKIPVENEKVVSDALNLFGQLFKAFGK